MDKFPSEILTTIFNHLHYSQKLQCKLVCRKWASVLQSGSDIQSVAIPFKWDESTNSHVSLPLIEAVQDGILNGENCRRLILYDYPDRALLAKLFPNLKLVYFMKARPDGQARGSLPELTPTQVRYLQNWHKNLETFVDSCYDKMTLNIFGSGIFKKLTTIKLVNNSHRRIELTTLIDKLKNAPNLKKLDLQDFVVDTADLENLHSNVPYLESLVLCGCLVESRREQSKVIENTKSVKELALIRCMYTDEFSLTLSQYITCTYSSLEGLSLIIDSRENDILKQKEEKNDINYTIQELTLNLRALKSDVICTDTNSTMELTNNAPFLEVLSIDVAYSHGLMTSILELDTFANTLCSLMLSYTLPFDFKLFNRFSHLKQLSLNYEGPRFRAQTFELDTIINCLPESLEAFKLENIDLDLSPTHMNDNNISHIKSLTLDASPIKSDLSGYLSRRFPKLKSLAIFDCDTDFHFELPNHHLSFVEFKFNHVVAAIVNEEGKDVVKYVPKYFKLTTTGDVSTFYEPEPTERVSIAKYVDDEFFDKHDSLQYNICKPTTKYREEKLLFYFHFRCASVQTLLLNRQLIL